MLNRVTDRRLPLDHAAFVAAEPSTGRIIIIAPTRAACETIEIGLTLHIDTVLEREHGSEIRALASSGTGFGIVAGTGTGKTLAVRPIAEAILGTTDLRIGVVNREREATPETPTWNVIIVTTGIARRWFQDSDILPQDTLVIDEIHQTSAELELCLALGKRVGCRFIWLSATVDPSFYKGYLRSSSVIESTAFDPARAADVRVVRKDPAVFLDDRFLQRVVREHRGVGMFLPTRAAVEQVAAAVGDRFHRMTSAFYHGGEPIRVIRPFLEGDGAPRPWFLAMTAAGQSALNLRGLDTVIIDDTRFANVVERGKNVLTRLHLGTNEILQMAGRVHGRVEGGRVWILSDRDIDFAVLRPTAPEFQLAGDSERVAMTCADLGVRADDLDLPVPLDRNAYRRAMEHLEARGVVENGRLSRYGRLVEALPVVRPWAELLVHGEGDLLPLLAVMSSIESLHRMTRDERDLSGLIVPGSDHLTAYNLYAEAFGSAGYIGQVYGLPRHLFDEERIERWATRRGALVKAIEDAALATASVLRALDVPLPERLPMANDRLYRRFADLVARIMPFDLVIDEELADGGEARVSRSSVCGSWGAVAGSLRYFADRFGVPRASIEGTQIPNDLVRQYAVRGAPEIVYAGDERRDALLRRTRVTWFGFELDRDEEFLDAFPSGEEDAARRALAHALAREEARHPAVRRNRDSIREARDLYRRSVGQTARLGEAELVARYLDLLQGISSMHEYRSAALRMTPDPVDAALLARLRALPDDVDLRGFVVRIEYDIEDTDAGPIGVARLVLPERMARTLVAEELPVLDRPLRFAVYRGQRGALRAASLDELQELLDRPWTPEEASRRTEREEAWRRKQRERSDDRRGPRDAQGARKARDGRRVNPAKRRRRS